MKKKITSMILAIVLILSVLGGAEVVGMGASATSGSCGTHATYTYNTNTKTLTISGTGAVDDYRRASSAPWYDFKSEMTTLIVNEGITQLGTLDFYLCTSLTSVSLPSTLTTIKGGTLNYGAFRECTALTSITLPSGITTLDDMVFRGCSALTSISLPGTITTLGLGVFEDCTNLQTVTFGEGMTTTGVETFKNTGVKYVNFSSTITTISGWTFFNSRIESIEIPESVTAIGTRAFADCTHLTDVTVYNPNTEYQGIIGEDPFNGSEQSITFHGHSGSTTQTYAENKNYIFLSIDPCDHLSTHEVITLEPTCTDTGITTQVCDSCGFVVSTADIPANGHTWGLTATDDRTNPRDQNCDGHIYRSYECSVCHDTMTEIEHVNWVEGYYDYTNTATCTRPGIETYTCLVTDCGEVERNIASAGNHTVSNWTITIQPTCTEPGERTGQCEKCYETVTEEIEPLGHDLQYIDEFDNTDEDGHTYEIYYCRDCEEQILVPTHVSWVEGYYETETIVAPKCVIDGVGRDLCQVDGCGAARAVVLPANGEHDWYVTSTVEPTCTNAGATYYACHNCNLTKQERNEALGHDYVLDQANSLAPTCTVDGYEFYVCSRSGCTSSKRVVLPATGHTPVDGSYVEISAATCTTDGECSGICSVCGENYDVVIPALGHDMQNIETPIPSKPGHVMSTPTCSRCGKTETATMVHNEWLEGCYTTQVVTQGSCTIARITRDTCNYCGLTRTETTPAPGHAYSYTGQNETGYLTYLCATCDNTVAYNPTAIMELWRTSYINHSPSEYTLGYTLNLNNDGYINAKDYSLLKRAVAEKERIDEGGTTESTTESTSKNYTTPIVPL